jgi:acyl-coenzyme A thioesterase PaaI-like protein
LENHFGLQLAFYDDGEGEVYAEYVVPSRYEGYPGTVHGGIVASMLDELLGRALMAQDANHFTYSAKLTIRYRVPIPIGEKLKMVGRVERQRGRLAFSKAEIRLPDGTLAADAEATLVDIPDMKPDALDLEDLGWKVYPDSLESSVEGKADE